MAEPSRPRAVLQTRQGDIEIEFFPDKAPGHVKNFLDLARKGFYDGTTFHRVIPGFMIQGGDPETRDPKGSRSRHGTGGPGYSIKAEFNDTSHKRGIVSMARAQDPNSGDSQFFICFDDARFLDNQYTVWGKVSEGMENVDKIKRGEPVQNPDKIVKARMAVDAA